MATWASKDPTAVFDYLFQIPLDAGDSIAPGQATLTRLSGTVAIDSQTLAGATSTVDGVFGQSLTAWLSGGVDGETDVFKVAWTTVASRQDDDIITLAVVSKEVEALVLTGYAKPQPGHLTVRYPAFADVPVATVQYWLTDAERYVTSAWGEGDYGAGLMSLAAHNMALAGLGTGAGSLSGIPAGVTRMKSGSLELGFTEAAANARMSGGTDSTIYGAEYRSLLRRNRGGPLVAPTGAVPCEPYFLTRLAWGC